MCKGFYGLYSAEAIRDGVAHASSGEHVVVLGNERYTTREMIAVEQSMAKTAKALALRRGYCVNPDIVEKSASHALKALALRCERKEISLSEEQKEAVISATGDSALAVIQGRAGVRKTTNLAIIHEAYKQSGYRVEGVALSGQASKVLMEETGITSRTIASWMQRHEMNHKTVLIVDEAGMVGSRKIQQILEEARGKMAKVILVGDERQLQPIEAGNALRAVDQVLIKENAQYSSQIVTIRRQKEAWMRDAVRAAAERKIGDAIDKLSQHKKIDVYTNAVSAREALVKDFLESGELGSAVVLTHRRSDVYKINMAIREQLQVSGEVGPNAIEFHNGKEKMCLGVGDQVILGKNEYKLYDIRNGDRGVVTGIDEKTKEIAIQFDNGVEKKIATSEYGYIHYGWATTTHKAQGLTVDRAFVYGHSAEAMATAEATYVQISRSREKTRLYIVGGEVAVERPADMERSHLKKDGNGLAVEGALNEMKRIWSKSGAKDTTLDYHLDAHQLIEKTVEIRR